MVRFFPMSPCLMDSRPGINPGSGRHGEQLIAVPRIPTLDHVFHQLLLVATYRIKLDPILVYEGLERGVCGDPDTVPDQLEPLGESDERLHVACNWSTRLRP